MKVLFIGGTGEISAACASAAVARGIELHVLTRGRTGGRELPREVRRHTGDGRAADGAIAALAREHWDAVVEWVAFTPEHVRADVARFAGSTAQYVFISSASAYQKPLGHLPITESTPLRNPVWPYSQAKIACEDLLVAAYREQGFPVTIVRPSHTYDRTQVPYDTGWTMIERIRQGRPVVVHGDGTSLWTLTHAEDFARAFVGLLGRPEAIGDAFHITSDHALTWNAIVDTLAQAAGAEAKIVHVSSDAIHAADAEWGRSLLGDKAHSVIFDNTKIRRLVPGWVAAIPFADGAREIIAWHDADAARRRVDPRVDALLDALVARYGSLR